MPTTHFITANDMDVEVYGLGENAGGDSTGPHFIGGNIFVVFRKQVLAIPEPLYYAEIWASTDDGATWAPQDQANQPQTYYPVLGAKAVGASLVVAYADPSTRELALRPFNTGTFTWGADLATGGPVTAELTGSGDDFLPPRAVGLVHNNGVYTFQFRSDNGGIDALYERTQVARWSAADGWVGPFDTDQFGASSAVHYFNHGGVVDSSGVHLLVGDSGSLVELGYVARIAYQRLNADNSLSEPVTVEAVGGGGDEQAAFTAFVRPQLIGGQIYFAAVSQAGDGLDPFGDPDPVINVYRVTPGTGAVSTFAASVASAAPTVYPNGAATAITAHGPKKIGIVTTEFNGSYSNFYYHDITDLLAPGQKLLMWPAWDDTTIAEPATCYGCYFDDDGLVGSPFVVYQSSILLDDIHNRLTEIYVSDPVGGTFPYSYLGRGGRASFAGTGPFSLLA